MPQTLSTKKTYPALVVEIAQEGQPLPPREGYPDKYSHKMTVSVEGKYFPQPFSGTQLVACQFTTDDKLQYDVHVGQSTYIYVYSYSKGEANVKIGNGYEVIQVPDIPGPATASQSVYQSPSPLTNGRQERIGIKRCTELALLNFSRKGNFSRARVWEWARDLYRRYNGYHFEAPVFGTEIITIDVCAEMAVNYGKSKGYVEETDIGEIGIEIYEFINNMSYKY